MLALISKRQRATPNVCGGVQFNNKISPVFISGQPFASSLPFSLRVYAETFLRLSFVEYKEQKRFPSLSIVLFHYSSLCSSLLFFRFDSKAMSRSRAEIDVPMPVPVQVDWAHKTQKDSPDKHQQFTENEWNTEKWNRNRKPTELFCEQHRLFANQTSKTFLTICSKSFASHIENEVYS